MSKFVQVFGTRWGVIGVGVFIGVFAQLLQKWGNPANMGICVACFERDIAGALGLHRATVVQYMRPEIIGFVIGSLIAAYAFKEFRSRAGSAPIVRFVLGAFAMIGALVFLGCPWRAALRLAGESEQRRMEANGITTPLEDRALEVVVEQHPRAATEGAEGRLVAAKEARHLGVEEETEEELA